MTPTIKKAIRDSLTKDDFLDVVKQLNAETPAHVSLIKAQTEAAAAQSSYFRTKAASEERIEIEAKIDSLRRVIENETREARRYELQQKMDEVVDELFGLL